MFKKFFLFLVVASFSPLTHMQINVQTGAKTFQLTAGRTWLSVLSVTKQAFSVQVGVQTYLLQTERA